MLQDLQFDVASGFSGTAEHGRAADNDGAGAIFGGHGLDKVLESLEYTRILVGRHDEGLAFLLKNRGGPFDGGIDEGDDLEARAELTVMTIRGSDGSGAAGTYCSKRKEWFHGPSSEPGVGGVISRDLERIRGRGRANRT